MSKYGTTAIRAAELVRGGASGDRAWRQAADEIFPDSKDSRCKSCPHGAFLGLWRAGLIRGAPAGTRTAADNEIGLNQRYAVTAVRLLVENPGLARGSKVGLWRRVMQELEEDPGKRHNAQMDVVLALWNERLIDISAVHID